MENQKKSSKNLIQNKSINPYQITSLGSWYKQNSQKVVDEPFQRKYHSSIVHKSSVYIYGGIPRQQSQDHINEQKCIYRYNITTKIWNKSNTNFLNNNTFSYISGHSTAMYNNMMYLIGGRNYKTDQYVNGFWCLNIQSYNWKRQQLKCYTPSPRQFGTMTTHRLNTFILYGGMYNGQHLNDIHLFKVDNKIWIQIQQSSYDMKIPCRLKPALVSYGQYLYLFGGQRQIISHQNKLESKILDDFYQISIIQKPMNSKPDLWVKNIITPFKPPARTANFININDKDKDKDKQKYLILWSAQNISNDLKINQHCFWIFNINDLHWNRIKIKQSFNFLPQHGYTINFTLQKLFIFGQLQQKKVQDTNLKTNNSKQKNSGFLIYHVDIKDIDHKLAQLKNKNKFQQMNIQNCQSCYQYNFSLRKGKRTNQFTLLKDIMTQRMQFVYSAFGLLLDNALILNAKEVRIHFHHNFKEKYCCVFDNGNYQYIWNNNKEFIQDLQIFKTYIQQNIDQLEQITLQSSQKQLTREDAHHNNQIIQNTHINPTMIMNSASKQSKEQKQLKQKQMKDKQQEKLLKERKRWAKKNYRKRIQDRIQYSMNIKLGALRIGDRMIYINKYGSNLQNRRVFVIQKIQSNNKEVTYRSYYYIFQSNSLIDPNMQSAKKYIDQQYKTYLKLSCDHKQNGCNFVFITNLKEIINELGQLQPQLKQNSKNNDVYFCQKRQLQTLQQPTVLQSIDVSLKTYLSLLYLKNDDTKIFLGVGQHKAVEVSSLQLFQKIDNLVKTDKIIDLVQALDLQNCNIIEAYYNKTNNNRSREINRKTTSSFNCFNGVLLYYKNRLISRYKYQLGQVNRIFKNKPKSIQQSLIMFGFIQIKDQFCVNIFKTNFIRDDLLYEVYHRLKFVEKYAQRLTLKSQAAKNKPLDQRYQKNGKGGDKNDQKKRQNQKQSSNEQMQNSKQVINLQ